MSHAVTKITDPTFLTAVRLGNSAQLTPQKGDESTYFGRGSTNQGLQPSVVSTPVETLSAETPSIGMLRRFAIPFIWRELESPS